jgi:hypothetical protein
MNLNFRAFALFLFAAAILGVLPIFFTPFTVLMVQVAVYGLAVIFISRWAALGLVGLMAVLARAYLAFDIQVDMIFVLMNAVWVLAFSWALLDLKLTLTVRGLIAPVVAGVSRLGAVIAFESIGIGPVPYSPVEEMIALTSGGLAAIFAAAWLGPRLKKLLLREE